MTVEAGDWIRIIEAFDAIESLPAPRRAAALAKLPEPVRDQVEQMVGAAQRQGILDRDAPELGSAPVAQSSLEPGERVGGFVVDSVVGVGGMGEVFRAHRADAPFEQQVALKLMRADTIPNEAQFARERRFLARLDHPFIARLIDGGVTSNGRPWMAMQFIEGQPIDLWCETTKPNLADRLNIFLAICEVVLFAHANLVVHRDLKPGNILVDSAGRPHLVDFGIAKLLGETLPGLVNTGVLLTPSYAAPEQLEGGPITVATDVYGLGVILFQMMTGTTPWSSGATNLPDVVRRILDEDAPLPSRMVAHDYPIRPERLRGDIDAIVAKALRKDPMQRYATAANLAADIRHLLENRPVTARQGSRRYRLGRFLRRNRFPVAAGAALAVALVGGFVGVAIQGHRAAVERDHALAEVRRSDSMVQAMTRLFGQSGGLSDLTLKQALDQSSLRLLASLDRSERSGEAVNALVDVYFNMQDPKGALALLQGALQRGIGADSPGDIARMQAKLAEIDVTLGQTDDAVRLLDKAEAVFGRDPDRHAADAADAVGVRAAILRRKGDHAGAIALLQSTLPQARRAYAEDTAGLLGRYNNLLVYLIEANRLDDAGKIFAEVDSALSAPGAHDLIQAIGIDQLRASWLLRAGRLVESEIAAEGVLDRRRRLFGESAALATDLLQLGKTQMAQGKYPQATASLTEAQPIAERLLGSGSPVTTIIDLSLAQAQAEQGDIRAAKATMATAEKLIATLPQAPMLGGQIALTRAIVALDAGDRDGAKAAIAAARHAFAGMGPAGAFGLAGLPPLEKRIATGTTSSGR